MGYDGYDPVEYILDYLKTPNLKPPYERLLQLAAKAACPPHGF